MSTKLESQITREQALIAIEASLIPGTRDPDVKVVRIVREVLDMALLAVEMPHSYVIEMINDEDVVDIAWAHHILFGECLVVTHQCPEHPNNPLDRNVLHLTSVRRK